VKILTIEEFKKLSDEDKVRLYKEVRQHLGELQKASAAYLGELMRCGLLVEANLR
jgi:hypothetical protein